MKGSFIFFLLIFSHSLTLFGQKAKTTYIPAEYDTIKESVLVSPSYYKLVKHPAQLDTVIVDVTLREKSKILKENWRTTYSVTKKVDADSIPGVWVGVKDKDCISLNPEDCVYQIWVPESSEYDIKEYNTYLGAVWDGEIEAIVIQVPKIIEIQPERVERVFVPATYQTVEKYVLRKRGKQVIHEKKE